RCRSQPEARTLSSPTTAGIIEASEAHMAGAGSRNRRTKKIGTWVALLSLIMSTLGITLASVITNGASATLVGATKFDGTDKTLDAGVTDVTDRTGNTDDVYQTGTETDLCPKIKDPGSAPSQGDLDHFYSAVEVNGGNVFLYLAWHRPVLNGNTAID